MTLRHTLHHCV